MIVATARMHDCPLATADDKILNYAHVRTRGIGRSAEADRRLRERFACNVIRTPSY